MPSIFFGAEHDMAAPPLVPEQAHVHGPLPFTLLAVPFRHRSDFGALVAETPLDEPHCASSETIAGADAAAATGAGADVETVATGAAQLTVMPPLAPLQFHVQGPLPETDDAEPAAQRPLRGLMVTARPLDEPQLASISAVVETGSGANRVGSEDSTAATGAAAGADAEEAAVGEALVSVAGPALASLLFSGGTQPFETQTSCKLPAGHVVRVSPRIWPT